MVQQKHFCWRLHPQYANFLPFFRASELAFSQMKMVHAKHVSVANHPQKSMLTLWRQYNL